METYMLESTKIQRRQSEIRQQLSELASKEQPDETETRQMDELDREYRSNESRYRAALVAEDTERRSAADQLETRAGSEWADLIGQFEVRQAVAHLDEGRALNGATAEVVQELRNAGGYRGCPVPYEALETRAGETVASGVPDPVQTRPIIDRLFPQAIAGAMGAQMVNVGTGEIEYPVTTSSVKAGWAASETGDVASATAYTTADRPLKPDQTLGVQMKLTRRTMKSTSGIEQAVRRDMRGAIQAEMDKAVFLGTGSNGQPLGVIQGASTYGISETAIDAAATWSAFRGAVTTFMTNNAAGSPGAVRVMIRPEVWDALEGAIFDAGSGVTEWDRFTRNIPAGNVSMTSNALAAPSGSPTASKSLLTTSAGGQTPIFVATWGAVDLIRDPYTDAASGGVRLTGLVTMDVTVSRTAQLEVLTGVQD
jgi:HK97 family phage major capsid protein